MSHARCIGIVHDEVEVRNVAEIPFTLGLDGHNPLAVENLTATVAVGFHSGDFITVGRGDVRGPRLGREGTSGRWYEQVGVAVLQVEFKITFRNCHA